jgi:ArsR family transcriptional regulator
VKAATKVDYASQARIIKALAHPARLFILHKVSEGACSVNALTEMIGSDMSTVSRHLSVLRNAGILRDEKRGAQVFYHVRLPCVLKVFQCIAAIEQERARGQEYV